MAIKYKLNRTLYHDEDADLITDSVDIVNGKNEYPVFAKTWQIFTIQKLNEELKEEHCVYGENWKFIAISKNGKTIFFEEEDDNLLDWFNKVGE